MIKFYRFVYEFWRVVGSVALSVFHASQSLGHSAYVRGGRHGRRRQARKPLTAVWKWWNSVKAKF